jgi:hypothetical protein
VGPRAGQDTMINKVHPLYDQGHVMPWVSKLTEGMSGVSAFEFPNRRANTGRVLKTEYCKFLMLTSNDDATSFL